RRARAPGRRAGRLPGGRRLHRHRHLRGDGGAPRRPAPRRPVTARRWRLGGGALVVVAAGVLALAGCANYQGPSRPATPRTVSGTGWLRAEGVPLIRQRGDADCGLAVAAMVLRHHGRAAPAEDAVVPDGGLTAGAVRALF